MHAPRAAACAGKNLGRTKLTDISPKKTVEGALGGLASSVAIALGSHYTVAWPPSPAAAVGLGVRKLGRGEVWAQLWVAAGWP